MKITTKVQHFVTTNHSGELAYSTKLSESSNFIGTRIAKQMHDAWHRHSTIWTLNGSDVNHRNGLCEASEYTREVRIDSEMEEESMNFSVKHLGYVGILNQYH